MAARATGARERVDNARMRFKTTCAAVSEPACVRLGDLGLMHMITSLRGGSDGVGAHSGGSAQRELQRDAQVAREAERAENSDRAVVEIDMPM